MTVLRSREVKSVVGEAVSKNTPSNSKTSKQPRVSSIEPKTPCTSRETHSINAATPMTDTSLDGSRSGSVRRSLRLALKNCDNNDVKNSELVSSRKRKKSVVSVLEEDLKLGGGSGLEVCDSEGGDCDDSDVKNSELVWSRKRKSVVSGIEEDLKLGRGSGLEVHESEGGDCDDNNVKNSELVSTRKRENVVSGIEEDLKLGGGSGLDVCESEGGGVSKVAVVEDSLGSGMEEGDSGGEKGSGEVLKKGRGKRKFGIESAREGEGDAGCLRLRSGKKVVPCGGVRGFVDKAEVLKRDTEGDDDGGKVGGEGNGGQGNLKLSCDDEMEAGSGKVEALPHVAEGLSAETGSIFDEGKGRLSRKEKGKGKFIDTVVEPEAPKVEVSNTANALVDKEGSQLWKNDVIGNSATADRYRAIMAKRNKGSKGDEIDVWEDLISKCVEGMMANLTKADKLSLSRKGIGRVRDERVGPSDVSKRRTSRQEKGKGKSVGIVVESEAPSVDVSGSGNVAVQDGMPEAPRAEISNSDSVAVHDGAQVQENDVGDNATRTRDRFRAQARRSASRFAFFSTEEEEQNHVVDEAQTNMALIEMNSEMEDWPGPFSTAMKIIRERGMNVHLQQKNLSSGEKPSQVTWVPKQEKNHKRCNLSVPLLQELCMITLTNNADAITSLDYVPDVLRHKLSHMLCNMRRMNSHFLELLVRGSPTEIRIRDCSWLSEQDFTKIFAEADINNLSVLQLDQCGRCMPDYILYATLGRSPNCLPLLTTLSLKGACRLSDIGLSSLLSAAPALRSLNLCQCSLLTSGGINSIADSLGSVLRELYIDDCDSIDPILMLPALSKLEYLEVLSLAGLHTVSDDFICQLIALRGQKLKELVLADCVNLTDVSLKVISKSCTGICALDLTNLQKLTDSALGYLSNGCQFIRSLKLRRNTFSDEAVAAYLETSGGSLEELSLNNVSKVAYNTAISLSKCSKNLQNLDMSFCRNLSNEAVGLIADSCLSLKTLKMFGCTQITDVFLDGHSNEQLQVIGLQMTPVLGHIRVPELVGPLRYSSVSSV